MSNTIVVAKNTLFLFIRMIITILVSLYTSRIVLEYLGIDDFGLFNVVGGIVVMLTFINSSMSASTQRFLSIALGQDNIEKAKEVFKTAILIHIIIAFFFIIIAETIGLWFVLNKVNIPEGREFAAKIVYHFSVLSVVITFVNLPYNAALIATEKMSAFAYISVVEAFLKLIVALSLVYINMDKLVLYSILLFCVQILLRIVYFIYCKRNISFIGFKSKSNKKTFFDMLSYSSWMMIGTGGQLFSTQGVNVLLNMFFSVSVNAARGIAVQVNAIVEGFVNNFMIAVQPRIIKLYGQGDMHQMKILVIQASKVGFLLVCSIVIPITFEADFLLKFWLGNLPTDVILFTRLVLCNMLIVVFFSPLAAVIFAQGKLKKYQILISLCFISVFLVTYLLFERGYSSYITFIVTVVFSLIGLIIRVILVRRIINLSFFSYLKVILLPLLVILLLSIVVAYFVFCMLESGFFRFSVITIATFLSLVLFSWLLIINKNEKEFIIKNIKKYVNNKSA